MKELEVAELSFDFDVADFLKPGVEIQIQITDLLEFSKRGDNGIVEFSDMIGCNFATDDFSILWLECISTVEVLNHEVMFYFGAFLQEPYKLEIRIVETSLYRGKPVRLPGGESPAWACDHTKHGHTAQQRGGKIPCLS